MRVQLRQKLPVKPLTFVTGFPYTLILTSPFMLTPERLLLIGVLVLGLMLLVTRRGAYNRFTRSLMDVLMASALVAFGSAILMLIFQY